MFEENGHKSLDEISTKQYLAKKEPLKYEVLDDVLQRKQLNIARRLIFTTIEVVKSEKMISKDTEIRLNFAIENAILDVLNRSRWYD